MPEAVTKPVFQVNPDSDPVLIRIEGRASFANSATIRDFLATMKQKGRTRFVMDFRKCMSMDSTFLGVLAGAALDLRKLSPPGSLVLARMGQRNLELVRNLGLHRLMTVEADSTAIDLDTAKAGNPLLSEAASSELESARVVLEAHENLVAADPENRGKFQDVLAFLKTRLEQG